MNGLLIFFVNNYDTIPIFKSKYPNDSEVGKFWLLRALSFCQF
jgi:hypothetical protein